MIGYFIWQEMISVSIIIKMKLSLLKKPLDFSIISKEICSVKENI